MTLEVSGPYTHEFYVPKRDWACPSFSDTSQFVTTIVTSQFVTSQFVTTIVLVTRRTVELST